MHPALAVLATLVSFAPHGNRIEMRLDRGSAELVWVSPTSFHFRRTLDGPLAAATAERSTDLVALQVDDTPAALRMRSKYLDVTVQKRGLLVSVRRPDGTAVLVDASEPQATATGVQWEREAISGARFYGLGAIADPELDLRGKAVDATIPFLICTSGYAEQHAGGGHFDFSAADRYRIQTPVVDYYFFYGPTPKELFKQRNPDDSTLMPYASLRRPASWEALRDALLEAIHQAMSTPASRLFPMANYANAPEELKQRARQFGSLLPGVTAGAVGFTSLRRQLNSFFDIYEVEVRDQGRPIWHALPFQFPEDPECAHHADEFLLGDEMLIAPIYQPGNKREVYLPPGNWTSLETNQEYAGRRTITVETPALPVFARNGAIIPLDSEGGLGLHYFPRAGGEFFLLEKELDAYTQVHASPALDIIRLEIESKRERDYQWVVHHVERPVQVGFDESTYQGVDSVAALKDRTWYYDAAAKNLMVRVHVKAGEDHIVNVAW